MPPANASGDASEYPCLVRVTNGKEVNFSTRVSYLLDSLPLFLAHSHIGHHIRWSLANSNHSIRSTEHFSKPP